MNITAIRADKLTDAQWADWSALQQADPAVDNPCFHGEFVRATGAVRADTEVAVIEDEDRNVGFWPFHRGKRNVATPLADLVTDMHGIVAERGIQIDAVKLLRACRLSCWKFDHLVASQELFRSHHATVEDSYAIDLSGGYEQYENSQRQTGTSAFSRARQKTRKIERDLGPLRFQIHTDSDEAFAALVDWKRSQIRAIGGFDTFRYPWVVQLMDRLRHIQGEAFSGQLSALYAGERLVAVMMGLRCRDVFSAWIPTFDESLGKYSPGLIMHLLLARRAAEMGIKRIDLGRGHNRLKASLSNGAIDVALGAVERRRTVQLLRSGWYGLRTVVNATPLRGAPLRLFRRIKNGISNTLRKKTESLN